MRGKAWDAKLQKTMTGVCGGCGSRQTFHRRVPKHKHKSIRSVILLLASAPLLALIAGRRTGVGALLARFVGRLFPRFFAQGLAVTSSRLEEFSSSNSLGFSRMHRRLVL